MRKTMAQVLVVVGCLTGLMICVGSARAQDEGVIDKIREAQQLIGEEEFAEASELLNSVLEADPENGTAAFFLGYALHMAGDLEAALEAHQKAAESEQFGAIATYNIGCAHALLGHPQEALAALNEAVERGYRDRNQFRIDSDLDSLRMSAGFAYLMADVDGEEELGVHLREAQRLLEEGEFAEAAELYQTLADEHKDNGFVVFRLGYALHATGNLDEAKEVHERAAEFAPFEGIATYNLGCVHALQGDTESALECLEKAVDSGFVRPDHMKQDSDLESLRENETFVALVERAEEMIEKQKEEDDE